MRVSAVCARAVCAVARQIANNNFFMGFPFLLFGLKDGVFVGTRQENSLIKS